MLSFLLVLSFAGMHAQEGDSIVERRPDFNLSMIIAGDASVIALGLEKLFFIKPAVTLAGKLGFGTNQEFNLFGSDPPINYIVLWQNFTANFGRGRSFLECGLGGALLTGGPEMHYVVYPLLGYRFHPFKTARVSFKAWLYFPYNKVYNFSNNDLILLPYGMSVGIAL